MDIKKITKKIYKAFPNSSRPEIAVDELGHCLTCDETQEAHRTLKVLKYVTANDFRLCHISLESLSASAFLYYMPRLLELAITEENTTKGLLAGNFIISFVDQLVPNKWGDRFDFYGKEKIDIIIEVLNILIYKNYMEYYEEWDYDLEIMIDKTDKKELVEVCEKTLIFWENKRRK